MPNAKLFPAFILGLAALSLFRSSSSGADGPSVVVEEDAAAFVLRNGTVTARVAKHSGDLLSLEFRGQEMLHKSGRGAGYWSHNTALGKAVSRVSISPETNGGQRGEVAITALSEGKPLGSGPGGSAIADIEIRYAVERGSSGLFTYCIFEHRPNYPAFSLGEARFCIKLNDDLFDWMTVDAKRDLKMPTAYDWNHGTVMNMKEARRMNTGILKGKVEHKYDYSANQFDVRAWGWSSSAKNLGLWLVNPSVEYLSGGPTKFELCAHRDATFGTNLDTPAPPTLLNYWRSSHYGGSSCVVREGEAWTKVIGPFLIYCNAASDRAELWPEALRRAEAETKSWPYEWVSGVDYPHRNERGTITGTLVLKDSTPNESRFSGLLVGLTPADYLLPAGRRMTRPQLVDWQKDAKGYQFWVRGDNSGRFSIPNVRPGTFTLHAISDGMLGEFILTNVAVQPGKMVQLGELRWQPVRYGKQIWDIGIPNRTGSEFFKGDDYFHWGWYLEYPKLFPKDVDYTIGRSDYRKDWFFEQVPHCEDPGNTTGQGQGRETTWTIRFPLDQAPRGEAILRLAICGVGTRQLATRMNGKESGALTNLVANATINRDGIGGTWSEHLLRFDASLMKAGENILTLTIPAGGLTSGIIYDYLRLELNEAGSTASTAR